MAKCLAEVESRLAAAPEPSPSLYEHNAKVSPALEVVRAKFKEKTKEAYLSESFI